MSYHPVFDNNYFDANSTLFIPTFKSLQKPTLSNSEATLSGLISIGLDEWAACEKLRASQRSPQMTAPCCQPPFKTGVLF